MSEITDKETKCRYCAEIIKSEAITCPHCGESQMNDNGKLPKIAACRKCNVQLVTKEEKKSVTITGVLGVIIFLIGIAFALVNFVIAIVIIAFSIFVGRSGNKTISVMVCPACGKQGRKI